jgi:hypothetical protein
MVTGMLNTSAAPRVPGEPRRRPARARRFAAAHCDHLTDEADRPGGEDAATLAGALPERYLAHGQTPGIVLALDYRAGRLTVAGYWERGAPR